MRVFLWILAFLAVAALVLWMNAGMLASRGIDYVLGKQNIPITSYRIVSLSRSRVVLRDVVLGDHGEVTAAGLDLRIGWNGRKAETLDLVLDDADMMAKLTGDRLTLDGVERAWDKAPAAPNGASTDIRIIGDLRAHYALGGALKVDIKDMKLIASRESRDLLVPLVLNGTAEGDITKILTYSGTLVSEKKQLSGTFGGRYDVGSASGKTDWSIAPVRFAPDGLTFATLSPFYAGELPTFPMRVSAKGALVLTKGSWKLSPKLTFHELPLETLLAGILGEDAKVQGLVAGGIPLTVTPERWKIQPAQLSNKGGLTIAVSPVGAAADMLQAHPQSQIVLAALGNFHVDAMTLDAKSTDDHGGMSLKWHFLGANPELYGGKKVDFTLAVNANLEDIWTTATRAEKLAEKAQYDADNKGATR